MVNFSIEQGEVRFDINAEDAGRAARRISAQPLQPARIIAAAGAVE